MTHHTAEDATTISLKVEAFPPPPTCWPVLETADATEAMTSLAQWVKWLVSRYGLDHRTVPGCWAEHGALVEELSALHGAWNAAYAQTAHPSAPLDWHTNFASSRERLADWIARTGCRPGTHHMIAVDDS